MIMKQGGLRVGVLLLVSGLIAAGAAWAFWHYLGENAFPVLMTVVIVAQFLENRRLRQRLKHHAPDCPPR